MRNSKVKSMTYIGLITALICVVAPLTVPLPFSPVPISFANLIIYLCTVIVGTKKGTISVLLYILIGAVGVPVYSGYNAGLQRIVGPTGGYLLGFIACAVFTGLFAEKFENRIYMYAVGMVIGTAVCYIMGTVWLSYSNSLTFMQALCAGVVPFVPGDAVKIVIAALAGYKMRKLLGNSIKY